MNIIDDLLNLEQPFSLSPVRFSTPILLLKGARKLAGRNLKTGVYEKKEFNDNNFDEGTYHSFQFMSISNYLILLEQFGGLFNNKLKSAITEEREIIRALESFTDMKSSVRYAIYSLRNSLLHKFGLTTEIKPKPELMHKFTLSIDRNSDIVSIREKDWNSFSDKDSKSNTIVYIIDLIDLIEKIYSDIIIGYKAGNIELRINEEELKARYTIIY